MFVIHTTQRGNIVREIAVYLNRSGGRGRKSSATKETANWVAYKQKGRRSGRAPAAA